MGGKFDPRSCNRSLDEIIPPNESQTEIEEALDEIEPVVEGLTEDISGIGPKAVERYLLRYEYGKSAEDLAEVFEVAPQTLSNQISTVRSKVLKYPRLARMVGTLRAHRADISQPNIDDGRTWEGKINLKGEPIEYRAKYLAGTTGTTYSWGYSCESRYVDDNSIYHLYTDYLIDEIHGVMLKRLMKGFSLVSWTRPPVRDVYIYRAYALPNLEVPNNRNGSLLDAAEYHLAYDCKNHMEKHITGEAEKGELEIRAKHGETPLDESAYHSLDDVLSHRIRNCEDSTAAINNYSEKIHIRNNIERLLRTYPLDSPFNLPDETITLLWNGEPTDKENYVHAQKINKQELYSLATKSHGVHKGRDVHVSGTRYIIEIPNWSEKINSSYR